VLLKGINAFFICNLKIDKIDLIYSSRNKSKPTSKFWIVYVSLHQPKIVSKNWQWREKIKREEEEGTIHLKWWELRSGLGLHAPTPTRITYGRQSRCSNVLSLSLLYSDTTSHTHTHTHTHTQRHIHIHTDTHKYTDKVPLSCLHTDAHCFIHPLAMYT